MAVNRSAEIASTRVYSQITSPVSLLAFLGAVVEAVVGILAYRLQASALQPYLVLSAILLPVFLITVIYLLITRHHYKLYSPRDFQAPEFFLKVLEQTRGEVEKVGQLNPQRIYRPFVLSEEVETQQLDTVREHVEFWQGLLENMDAEEFMTLHSWYDEMERYNLALLCLDIAIAKGKMASKNFSFKSANLRKLGRFKEARSSAELALAINRGNVDAHYNLSIIYREMGLSHKKALEHARKAKKYGEGAYDTRLFKCGYFPELFDAE